MFPHFVNQKSNKAQKLRPKDFFIVCSSKGLLPFTAYAFNSLYIKSNKIKTFNYRVNSLENSGEINKTRLKYSVR